MWARQGYSECKWFSNMRTGWRVHCWPLTGGQSLKSGFNQVKRYLLKWQLIILKGTWYSSASTLTSSFVKFLKNMCDEKVCMSSTHCLTKTCNTVFHECFKLLSFTVPCMQFKITRNRNYDPQFSILLFYVVSNFKITYTFLGQLIGFSNVKWVWLGLQNFHNQLAFDKVA